MARVRIHSLSPFFLLLNGFTGDHERRFGLGEQFAISQKQNLPTFCQLHDSIYGYIPIFCHQILVSYRFSKLFVFMRFTADLAMGT